MMQGTTAAVPAIEDEERYVKLASRFFRVKLKPTTRDGGGAAMPRLHYLDSCFLCKKDIASNRDVFMYKGDAAFCSEDCRQDQMDMDDALHAVARRHRLSSHAPPGAAALGLGEVPPVVMRRRPTIANLAPRNPPVAAT